MAKIFPDLPPKGRKMTHKKFIVGAIWLLFVGMGSCYALYTPAWQAPDEPAHYNYIRQLAEGNWPVMEPADYNQAYQSEVISAGFAPPYTITTFTYEDYQPPLYYLLQTPIFWLSNGNLLVLRLSSLLLCSLTLLLAYAVMSELLPHPAALTALVIWAFIPQHLAMSASVNNDALGEFLVALLLWLLIQHRPGQSPHWLGLVMGLALLTKVTAYLMGPVIALVLLWQTWGDWRTFSRQWIVFGGLALAIGSLWWGRNLWVYGGVDFLGIQAHDAVVVGQPQTSEWIAEYGLWFVVSSFVQTSFQSFWGQFGWMGVVMPTWVYRTLLLFSVLVWLGMAYEAWQLPRPLSAQTQHHVLMLLSLFALNCALLFTYNLTYVQHQGRYLFASLIPIGCGMAWGLQAYTRPVAHLHPLVPYLIPLGVGVGLYGLDALALWRFIVPTLGF